MADLTGGTSTWSTGTPDTASTLQAGVDQKRAAHINGPNAAILGLESVLGAASSLKGNKADLATRLAVAITADGVLTSAEPGDLCMSARATKTGWLVCDGTSYLRTTYPDLFTAIGTLYGAADGTHFNVPDFRSRVPIGAGTGVGGGSSGASGTPPSGGAGLNTIARGTWAGSEDAINVTHNHTASDSGHIHTVEGYINDGGGGGAGVNANSGQTSASPVGFTDTGFANITVANSGSSGTDKNLQPYLGVNIFIKT